MEELKFYSLRENIRVNPLIMIDNTIYVYLLAASRNNRQSILPPGDRGNVIAITTTSTCL